MRNWIRKYLGLHEVATAKQIDEIRHELLLLRNELVMTFNDEFSPKRKEMSNELGQRMIDKLNAEDQARRLTEGKL